MPPREPSPAPEPHSDRSPLAKSARPRRPARLLTKILLGLVVVLLALAAVIGVVVLPHLNDEPEFVAPDLVPAPRAVPTEGNAALEIFEIVSGGVPRMTIVVEEPLWEALEARTMAAFLETADWETIDQSYWQLMLPILEEMDSAARLPHSVFPDPPTWIDDEPPLPPLVELRQVAFAMRLRAEIAAVTDRNEVLGHLIAWSHWLAQLTEGSRTTIDHLVVSSMLEDFSESVRLHWQEGTLAGSERELIAALARNKIELSRVSESLRLDFARLREFLLDPGLEEIEWIRELPWSRRILYQPQRTLREYGEFLRASIAEGESTGTITTQLDMSFEFGLWNSLREGNALGRSVIGLMVTGFGKFYSRVAARNRELRALQIGLAIACVERETGALPRSLEELTPEFFAEIPADFESGKPIGYDREERMLMLGLFESSVPPSRGESK